MLRAPLPAWSFHLPATLLKNPGKVFSRIDLMKSAIAGGAVVLERTTMCTSPPCAASSARLA